MANAFYHFLFCLDISCSSAWSYGTKVDIDVPWQIVSRLDFLRSAAPSSSCFTGGEPEAWHDTAPQWQTQLGLASWDPIRCSLHCCTQHVHHFLPKPLGPVAKDMADFFFRFFFFLCEPLKKNSIEFFTTLFQFYVIYYLFIFGSKSRGILAP